MSANYPQAARTKYVTISVANTARDGTGTNVKGNLGLANGRTKGMRIWLSTTGNSVEDVVRIFWFNGTNYVIVNEINVPARTVAFNMPSFKTIVDLGGIALASTTEQLAYTTNGGQTYVIIEELQDN